MKNLENCNCCGGNDLEKIMDFSTQPLATFYHRGQIVPHFPLEVNLCKQCFHRQLSIVVDPQLMYENYLLYSANDPALVDHCTGLASSVMKWWHKNRTKRNRISIMDIGCNDGTLLEHFQQFRFLIQGVDPAKNLREVTKEKRIRVKVGYWGDGKTNQNLGRFDIISAIRTFCKVENLSAFLDDCLFCLTDEGCIVIETPYNDLKFDSVNHELISYFLVNSIKALADRKGLKIVRLATTNFDGKTLQLFLSKEGEHCPAVEKMIKEEKEKGLHEVETYHKWEEESKQKSIEIKEAIDDLKSDGKKVIGYGVSHKVNAILSYCDIDLDYIVGENALDYQTPGGNILVKPLSALKEEEEGMYILMTDQNLRAISENQIKSISKEHHFINYKSEIKVS